MTLLFSKVINDESGLCIIALGKDEKYYLAQGYTKQEVKQSDVDFNWYLAEKCPMLTDTEKQEQEQNQKDKAAKIADSDFIQNYLPYAEANGDDLTAEELYNLEEDIRNGNAVVVEDNSVVMSSLSYNVIGGYQLAYNQEVIGSNFKKGLLRFNWLQEFFNSPDINNVFHKVVSFTDLIRKYNIVKRSCDFVGLNVNYYNSDISERLSYIRAFTPKYNTKWFIPITMYETEFKCYDQNNNYIGSQYYYTDKTGETVDTNAKFVSNFIGLEIFPNDYSSTINECKNITGAVTVTANYTGKSFPNLFLWLIDDWSSDYYAVDTVDNQRDYNSGSRFREVRPLLNCDTWIQEVKDDSGNIAYTDWNNWDMYNAYNGSKSCYNNPIGSDVPAAANIYSDIKFTSATNSGNYKFTHKCFYVPQKDSTDYKAKKCYEIYNQLNNTRYWTSTPPTAGINSANCHAGDSTNDVAINEWRDFTVQWYTVQNGENTYYVKVSDITDIPTAGGNVPADTQLYNNRMSDEPAITAGENDTTFTDVTPQYACGYTSATCFVYNYNEQWGDENIANIEKYFSSNSADWGIWNINENNEKTTKVSAAFQWKCDLCNDQNSNFIENIFPASRGEFKPKFDIDNYFWWVVKVFEVKSNVTNVIAYCPFKGSAGEETKEHCLTSAGLEAALPDGEKWIYTGGFNGDFLGRYTKFQNGEL